MSMLDSFLLFVPYIGKILRERATVCLYDKTHMLYYEQLDGIDLGFKTGDVLPAGFDNFSSLPDKVNPSISHYPKEMFGVPLEGINVPIYDGNTLFAVLSVNYDKSTKENLDSVLQENVSAADGLVDMVQHVAAHAQQLQATSEQILQNSKITVEKSGKINEVATLIKDISEQTNLLGLNAAIEAARVGELGAGFGVVATEVRKLSVNAKQATGDIETALRDVQQSIRHMENEIAQITASSQEQSSLVGSFTDVIERLQSASTEMKSITNNLYRYSVPLNK